MSRHEDYLIAAAGDRPSVYCTVSDRADSRVTSVLLQHHPTYVSFRDGQIRFLWGYETWIGAGRGLAS